MFFDQWIYLCWLNFKGAVGYTAAMATSFWKKNKNCNDFGSVQKCKNCRFIAVTQYLKQQWKKLKNQCKKLLNSKHSVRATVTPLQQHKSLCLIVWCKSSRCAFITRAVGLTEAMMWVSLTTLTTGDVYAAAAADALPMTRRRRVNGDMWADVWTRRETQD